MPLFSSPGNGEREGVYMEGVECACMGRGRVCAYGKGGVCMHGEREDVCIWKESSVHGEREGVCIWKGGVCVHGEREGGRGVDVGNISVVKAVD